MDGNGDRYQKQPPRKKAPVKRVALSEEAKRAYEELVQKKDARDKEYGVHLPPDSARR